MMKSLLVTVSLCLMAGASFAQECPEGVTTCNISQVGDKDISADQTIGDTVNPSYAPDSATSSSSIGNTELTNVVQGDTNTNTNSASGNTSTNNNQSSANNNATNTMSNGNIDNAVTGGNLSQSVGDANVQGGTANTTGGNANVTGGAASTVSGPATTIGGSANTTGGSATTNSGSISNASQGGSAGISRSGNSRNRNQNQATGGQSQSVSRGGTGTARSNASGGNSSNKNQNQASNAGNRQSTNVDARNQSSYEYKEAARTAYAAPLNGYGPGNCFGDTNPSGSFTMGVQTIGLGATAASAKASNVCAIYQVGGPAAAAAYLAQMDPNAHRALVAAGVITTPSRVAQKATSLPYSVCEMRNGRPYIKAKNGRRDEAVSLCMAQLGSTSAKTIPTCPAGSKWDGRGCWKPKR